MVEASNTAGGTGAGPSSSGEQPAGTATPGGTGAVGRPPAELDWQTSSFSGGGHGGGECIQVAAEGDTVYLRESDHPEKVVVTTRAKWDAFVKGVQAGEFDSYIE